jgi:hypothetical protein
MVSSKKFTIAGLCAVLLISQLPGCSSDKELLEANRKLNEANERIAVLEARLAQPHDAAAVSKPSEVEPAKSEAGPLPVVSIAEPAPTGQQWSYRADEDAMTSGIRKTASVDSSNTVNFGFPYAGSQHGRLTLRTDPRHGKDAIFKIEQGQILCPSYEGCSVQVRFDDAKPVRFSASGAADHSTEVIFLDDYNGFLNKMKKAKRIRIAVQIYQNGSPVFEFDVSGFDLASYQGKTKG